MWLKWTLWIDELANYFSILILIYSVLGLFDIILCHLHCNTILAKNPLYGPFLWMGFSWKHFIAPLYGWGSTASRLQPLQGGSLLFTTKFPEIPGTHSIDLGWMKGWVDLGATQWFWKWDLWIGNQCCHLYSFVEYKAKVCMLISYFSAYKPWTYLGGPYLWGREKGDLICAPFLH